MYRYLKTSQVGSSIWVEIYNPPVNFLTTEITEELFNLIKDVEKDTSIRVFILTGGVEDNYIMHFSIPELAKISPGNEKLKMNKVIKYRLGSFILKYLTTFNNALMDLSPWYEEFSLTQAKRLAAYSSSLFLWLQMHRLYLAIERMNKVTIAAINGPCNGGGTEISACFDFRFMIGDQEFTIGQPECLIGIIPGGGNTQRLPRLIGRVAALELMLKGNQLSPEEAKRLGLITNTFKKKDFQKKVQEFADLMSKRPPVAIDAIKKSVNYGMDTTLRHGLSIEMEQSIRCFDTEDTKKAMKEYIKIIQDKIDVPQERRASQKEILDILENAKLVEKFNGR
ncbi:MAG: enoyl-CoA hydratase/isomerase family protein [Deltaproteobacteria bacterium]|nr:enoyl-CoA hydratase/isomerase family protein [Deltaproteobacteria bacterium]